MEDFSPATLQTLENGMFSISFDIASFDELEELEVADAFAEVDLEGNGYDWTAVLAPALERRDAQAYAAIEWDPEADTFVAISKDKASLLALTEVLREITSDRKLLASAIAAHDPDRT